MKITLFILSFLIVSYSSFSQVHVRGYYRSNGTYVQPHERTRPNHTVTDNYSYPGNYNPNKGSTSSYNSATGSTSSSTTPASTPIVLSKVEAPFPGVGKYRLNSPEPALRSAPNIDAAKVYTCPSDAVVSVLEDAGDMYCKASVNGHIGYIAKRLLIQEETYRAKSVPYKYEEPVVKEIVRPKPQTLASIGGYKYRALFNSHFDPAMRDSADINGNEIYTCPKKATVYVIEESNELYYKVFVNGYVGYVAKNVLVKY